MNNNLERASQASSSTWAIATSVSFLNVTIPTYIPNIPSELNSTVASQHASTDKDKLFFSLRSYSSFATDWDGYGGITPLDETVKDAINFLKILPNGSLLPYTGLAGDGQIDLFWEYDDIYIDISFTGNHTYSYYARDKQGKEYFNDNIPINNQLPNELINIIK